MTLHDVAQVIIKRKFKLLIYYKQCCAIKILQAILLGASDTFTEDKKMQVTVAFNRFDKGLVQRMPCIRFGFAHVVNNDYNQWEMYAIGGLKGPTILSQGNRFFASDNKNAKEVMYFLQETRSFID